MTICYFGDYDPEYPRTRVLIKGLEQNGVTVLHCRDASSGIKKYLNLFKKHRSFKGRYDLLLVGYSDSRVVPIFGALISLKPVAWEPLYSVYDNWVFDRKLVKPGSPKALYYWFLEWICCHAVNLIILDTHANIDSFIGMFHIRRDKFYRALVGTDTDVMHPRPQQKKIKEFLVHFHGKYIPVQGAEIIVRAADILRDENIHFRMIGTGQEFEKVKALAESLGLENITFVPRVSYEKLAEFMAESDVCLGLLGDIDRIDTAIPNKIYEAAAMRRAIINADTRAVHEVFTDREDIVLVKRGDPRDLAIKILELKKNPKLKEKIAENAYRTFLARATPEMIGKELWARLSQLLRG